MASDSRDDINRRLDQIQQELWELSPDELAARYALQQERHALRAQVRGQRRCRRPRIRTGSQTSGPHGASRIRCSTLRAWLGAEEMTSAPSKVPETA